MIEYWTQIQELLTNNTFQDYGVLGLFFNSLLSATAIPLPTEILTSALLIGGESELLVGVALVLGSVFGGLINYALGFGGGKIFRKFKKKQPKTKENDDRLVEKVFKKSKWGAIFFASWIPFLGDLILISAGAKRISFRKYLFFMITGKIFKTVTVILGMVIIF